MNIVSCKKENWWFANTTVHGKVTKYCYGIPMGGFTISLIRGDKLSHKDQKLIRPITTGSDGYYEIKFYHGSGTYFLDIGPYSIVNSNGNSDTYVKEGDVEINLPLVPLNGNTGIKLNINNTSPFNVNDSIHFNITEPNNPFYYQFSPSNFPSSFTGQSIDTTCFATISECHPLLVKLNWEVTKNGITNNYADSVVCTSGVTSYYAINY